MFQSLRFYLDFSSNLIEKLLNNLRRLLDFKIQIASSGLQKHATG